SACRAKRDHFLDACTGLAGPRKETIMSIGAALAQQVRERAGSRCEYCMMHQSLQGATFHIEHIIPEAQGGASALENLALACPGCNLRKSDRVQCLDADTNVLVHLFH